MHVFFATLLPYMRPILLANAAVEFSAAAVWIGSIFVPLPQRYAMLWTAITIGLCSFLRFNLRLVWIFGHGTNDPRVSSNAQDNRREVD